MILVTGATGTVGSEVMAALRAQSAPVRALVRTPEKADTLRGFDVEIAFGTFEDSGSLARAVDGVDHVFLVSPPGREQVEQERAVIEAVRSASSPIHIVKLAALGFDVASPGRLTRNHGEIVARLADSGVPHTVLAPNGFFQNLLGLAAMVQEQGVLAGPYDDAAISLVDVRDVAAVAAHALTSDGHEGATYEITGPEAVTYAEIAQRLSTVVGKEVSFVDVKPEQARASMIGSGMSDWLADGLLELAEVYRAGQAASTTEEVRKATGRDPRSVEEFLTDHKAAFAS